MKTYLWIIATAVSKIIKNNIIGKINNILIGKEKGIEVRRWISKCPLIILADNRTDKVIGRIKFLIDSIITIKKVKIIGDPRGTKWVIILLNDVIHPFSIKVNQRGKAIIIDKIICLEGVNT